MHIVSKAVLVVVAVSFIFWSTTLRSGDQPACTDVSKLDFANIAINVPEEGPVQLKDGKNHTAKIVSDGKNLGSEWEVTIEYDSLINPAPGVTLRLVNLNVDHLLGSGGWGYACIYACKDGHLHRIFQSKGHLYGVELKKINETSFTIRYGVYLKGDANCCPSTKAIDTYTWDGREGSFKRSKSIKGPAKDE